MKREFVPLAQPYTPKFMVARKFASIKLDGTRAVWIPPSAGISKCNVPFANKPTQWQARDHDHLATGLWSRNGNIIHAPAWFLAELPPFPVDLELYAGPNTFQRLRSIVSSFEPDANEWREISACILDAVDMQRFLSPACIQGRQISITIGPEALAWWRTTNCSSVPTGYTFKQRYIWLQEHLDIKNHCGLVEQTALSENPIQAEEQLNLLVDSVLAEGGEGVILRSTTAMFTCARTTELLKYKPLQDQEGTILGYIWGKEPDMRRSLTGTATGSRLGSMGGVVLRLDNGKIFVLSGTGFNLYESHMTYIETGNCATDEGVFAQGKPVSEKIQNILYPRGMRITFAYRSLTDDGLPVEARFLRPR